MNKIYSILLLSLLLPLQVTASEDCTASDNECTVTCDGVADDVDFDSAFSDIADGATLHVAAGTCNITTTVDVDPAKGFTLVGAGKASTTITDKIDNEEMFLFRVSTSAIDISGITFDGDFSVGGGVDDANIRFLGGSNDNSNIRIHDCDFVDFDKRAIVVQAGQNEIYTLIDNCNFSTTSSNTAWGIAFVGDGPGNSTWNWDNTDSDLGTADFHFVEYCTFTWTGGNADSAIDAYAGAKFVARHNTLYNIEFGWHGTDSGNYVSPLAFEVYDNTYIDTGNAARALIARGGSGVIYNNTWDAGYDADIDLSSYRSCSLNTYLNWGNGNGSSSWDGNTATDGDSGTATGGASTSMTETGAGWTIDEWEGYYVHNTTEGSTDAADCIAYVSSNTSDTLTLQAQLGSSCAGDSTFANSETYVITNGYPLLGMVGQGADGVGGYRTDGVYEWDNTRGGGDIDFDILGDGNCTAKELEILAIQIQEGRDYFNDTQKGGYTAYTDPHPLNTTTQISQQSITGASITGGSFN